MNILRKLTLVLAITLLPFALFGFGLSWSLHQVFGTPTHLEGALTKSGIYRSIVGNALDQAQSKQQGEPGSSTGSGGDNNVPFAQPAIRSVIEKAFPPEYLQTQTNGVLDNAYGWLQGKQANLNFAIDLTSAKTSLANGLGEYVQKQLSSLPVCAPDKIPTGDVDPFTSTCVPKGFDIAGAAAKAKDKIAGGDFLKDTQITPDTIKNDKGQTIGQQLQKAPKAYQHISLAIEALGAVALLLSVAVVFLSVTWRNGVRKLSNVYISIGAVTALLAWGISFGLSKATAALAKGSTTNKALQQSVLGVAKILAQDLQKYWLSYGIVLLVLGIGGLVWLTIIRPRNVVPKAPSTPDVPPMPTATATTTPATPVRTPRPQRKVQG